MLKTADDDAAFGMPNENIRGRHAAALQHGLKIVHRRRQSGKAATTSATKDFPASRSTAKASVSEASPMRPLIETGSATLCA